MLKDITPDQLATKNVSFMKNMPPAYSID